MMSEPTREQVDAMPGPVVLEFGTAWCPHCQVAAPLIAAALAAHPGVQHLKIEDGADRWLGRTYRVKLWPTFVFLRDGHEVERLVRPRSQTRVLDAVSKIVDRDGA